MTRGHILLPRDIPQDYTAEALAVTVSHCHQSVKTNNSNNQPSENLGVADAFPLDKPIIFIFNWKKNSIYVL